MSEINRSNFNGRANDFHGTEVGQAAALILPSIVDQGVHDNSRLFETADLLRALDCNLVYKRHIKLRVPKARTLFGQGVLDEVKLALAQTACTLVVVDGALTPTQQRNLETFFNCKVIDRTALILEIFGLRARTAEGKLQVEYARLQYERTRLVRTWTHLERQRGGRGFLAGPGETQLEADKRMIDRSLGRLQKQLAEVRKTRGLQRKGRKRNGVPVVALVGYTNAGNSPLIKAFTQAGVLSKDMVFATLDPTIRQFNLSGGQALAMIDTVGFITDLPTELVDSFRATLEEVLAADLLLHVRDISSPKRREQAEDVNAILAQLEADYDTPLPPIIEVWNKADLVDVDVLNGLSIPESKPEIVTVSAVKGTGLDALNHKIGNHLNGLCCDYQIHLAANDAKVRAWLYDNGRVLQDRIDKDGLGCLCVQLDLEHAGRFGKTFPQFDLLPINKL